MNSKLITILFIIVQLNSYSQGISDYLSENKKGMKDIFLDTSILNNYNRIFICENHGYHDNLSLTTKLLSEFAAQKKPVYCFLEIDYWGANLAQHYINSGNEKYLDTLFRGSGTFFQTVENLSFFKNIRSIKRKYHIKIQIIGIDVIGSSFENFRLIQNIFSNNNIKNALSDSLALYRNNKYSYLDRLKFAKRMLIHDEYFSELSNKEAKLAKYLFRNIIYYRKANISNNWDNTRDSLMYQNFVAMKKIYQIPDNGKFFFVFGREHGYLKSSNKVKWLGAWLSSENQRIFTIYYLYYNSKQMIPKGFIPGIIRYFYQSDAQYVYIKGTSDNKFLSEHKKGINKIKKSAHKNHISYYNLTIENSPFNKRNDLIVDPLKKYFTTDYIQSIVFIQKSEPSKKLDKQNKTHDIY